MTAPPFSRTTMNMRLMSITPPAEILRQHLYRVAETGRERQKGDKKARRYIADHRPSRQEPNPR